MSTRIPEHERKRLAELYAGMNDAQLEAVAEDWESLTEAAREELQEEITRRGESIVLEDAPLQADDHECGVRVTIREFPSAPQALAAKSLLDSAGIESFLVDENMVTLDWLMPDVIGSVKLQVKPDDTDAAIDALEQTAADDAEFER